jgi:hypothetical protein
MEGTLMTNKPLTPSMLLAAIAAGACFTNAASAQVRFHGMHPNFVRGERRGKFNLR